MITTDGIEELQKVILKLEHEMNEYSIKTSTEKTKVMTIMQRL